jgi:hypothetical protein
LRRALVTALIAAMVLAASPRRASAATDTVVRLEYQADEGGGCVGKDELRRMVADQLGRDPFRPDADQRMAIRITKTDVGFQGRIVWTEADGRPIGQRLLSWRSHDCHEIAANVAFAVALQLQLVEGGAANDAGAAAPDAGLTPPKTTGPIVRAPVTSENPSLSAEVPPVPGQRSTDRVVLAVGAGPAVGMGMAPQATVFGRLFVVARLRRWSAEIAADAALPVTRRAPDGSGTVVNAMGSSAAACAHGAVVSACLLGRLGWLRAEGLGVDVPSRAWGWFGEVGARLAATKELGRFLIGVHADSLVMLA